MDEQTERAAAWATLIGLLVGLIIGLVFTGFGIAWLCGAS